MGITNRLIMDVFMPALIFSVMIRQDFHPEQYVGLMLAGVILMLASGVLAWPVAKLLGLEWRSFVPPAMFKNWANLGIPLYVFTLGDVALGGGVMLVIVGNILCFTIGTYIYSGKLSGLEILKTPIILTVIAGILINTSGLLVPSILSKPIDMMGQVAIPLMLFSLGVRLTRVSWDESWIGGVMALFGPLVGVTLALLIVQLIPMPKLHQDILVLFGVLPPAVINFMLAEQYHREPEQVASMVLIGNLASIITIPALLIFLLSGT
jgi:predicted permease